MNMSCLFCCAAMSAAASFADVAWETGAIQARIDAAAAAGGGRVTVTKGVHPCGTIWLKSGVELHLEEGAVLRGGGRSEDYADVENSDGIRPEANPPFSRKAFVVAVDAHDIAITGKGVIDGQGTAFFDHNTVLWGQWWQKPPHPRPRMIQFARCRNVRLEGVTFKDSPMWTMWMRRCENLTVSGIRVEAHPKIINSDGIDVDGCRHVRIGDSFFSTGDDCIVLRAIADRTDPAHSVVCEDVVVSNCTLRSVCQGVRIGCPSDDLIRNVVFRDIVFEGRNAVVSQQPLCYLRTDLLPQCRGLLKTRNILFENWKATCSGRPVEISVQEGIVLSDFGHMTFRNFEVKADKPILVHGNAASHVKDVRFENLKGAIAGGKAYDIADADVRQAAKDTVFFIGAHPDDIENCLGLMLKMKERYDVQVIDFTRGENGCGPEGYYDGTTGARRTAEEREVCKPFGLEPIFLSQVNHAGLAHAEPQVTAQIVDLIVERKPKAVFVNWPIDGHTDHVQCSAATMHAVWLSRGRVERLPELYFYEEPAGETRNFHAPCYYVDVGAQLEEACAQICKYVCQNGKAIADRKRVRLANHGKNAPRPVPFAEVYTTFDGTRLPGGVVEEFAVSTEMKAPRL